MVKSSEKGLLFGRSDDCFNMHAKCKCKCKCKCNAGQFGLVITEDLTIGFGVMGLGFRLEFWNFGIGFELELGAVCKCDAVILVSCQDMWHWE